VTSIPSTSKPGTNTAAGAAALDQCYPKYFQIDENQGTHLVDVADLSQATSYTSAAACAAACETEACMAATWIYDSADPAINSGKCYTFPEPTSGSAVAAFKVLPLDSLSGSSVKGKAAASGAYVAWRGDSGAMLGRELSVLTATSTQACKDACDAASACVLVYLEGTTCTLRAGLEAPGARTFINVVESQVE
jgi:hypothetical protein